MLKEDPQRVFVLCHTAGLNPYFNGTCSKSYIPEAKKFAQGVLILILMEHAQREEICSGRRTKSLCVLILILMEHAQRVKLSSSISLRQRNVLILILMEHAQREHFL